MRHVVTVHSSLETGRACCSSFAGLPLISTRYGPFWAAPLRQFLSGWPERRHARWQRTVPSTRRVLNGWFSRLLAPTMAPRASRQEGKEGKKAKPSVDAAKRSSAIASFARSLGATVLFKLTPHRMEELQKKGDVFASPRPTGEISTRRNPMWKFRSLSSTVHGSFKAL